MKADNRNSNVIGKGDLLIDDNLLSIADDKSIIYGASENDYRINENLNKETKTLVEVIETIDVAIPKTNKRN